MIHEDEIMMLLFADEVMKDVKTQDVRALKPLSKKERHSIYKKSLQDLTWARFPCVELGQGIRKLRKCDHIRSEDILYLLPEFDLFKPNIHDQISEGINIYEDSESVWFNSRNKDKFKLRKQILLFCIEMTKK